MLFFKRRSVSTVSLRARRGKPGRAALRLEGLEQRVLLDGAGLSPPPPATHFLLIAPEHVDAGSPAGVELIALDAANHVARDYAGTVHFTSTDTATGVSLPADYTFTAHDHGSHLFSARLATVGSDSITATDTAASTLTGSATVIVTPADVATHFELLVPESVTPGTPTQVEVLALDAANHPATNYLGTVHFSSSDSAATLPADYTFVASDHGKHSFSVTFGTAGPQTLTATDTATSTLTGSVTVNPSPAGVATHFELLAPEDVVAGKPAEVAVLALDASNHLVQDYGGTVSFTSSDSHATLPANYTFQSSDEGIHLFSVTFSTPSTVPGSATLTATDTSTSSLTGSITVDVLPAPVATSFLVITPEQTATGQQTNVAVLALDAANHLVSDYTGTVQFSSTDTSATLPANYTFVAADHGRHVFHVTFGTVGSPTLTVTDTAKSSLAGSATLSVVAPSSTTHHGRGDEGENEGIGRLADVISERIFAAFAGEDNGFLDWRDG